VLNLSKHQISSASKKAINLPLAFFIELFLETPAPLLTLLLNNFILASCFSKFFIISTVPSLEQSSVINSSQLTYSCFKTESILSFIVSLELNAGIMIETK